MAVVLAAAATITIITTTIIIIRTALPHPLRPRNIRGVAGIS
jgi:hypothetical protein